MDLRIAGAFAVASACTACILGVNPLLGALVGVAAHPSSEWGHRTLERVNTSIAVFPIDGMSRMALAVATVALASLAYCVGIGVLLSAAGCLLTLKEIAILSLVPVFLWHGLPPPTLVGVMAAPIEPGTLEADTQYTEL